MSVLSGLTGSAIVALYGHRVAALNNAWKRRKARKIVEGAERLIALHKAGVLLYDVLRATVMWMLPWFTTLLCVISALFWIAGRAGQLGLLQVSVVGARWTG